MKISIITICYNSGETIRDTIESVIAQTYSNIEYVIIDGASKDNTLDIVDEYKEKIATIVSEPDKGLYDAINKGIKNATGDYVGLIHADDILANPNVVTTIAKKLGESNYDAIYSDLQYVNQKDVNKVFRNWISGDYKSNSFKLGWMPPHPTFYAKKELFDKLGYYNLELTSAADYELMLRFIHKYQIKLGYIPEVLVKMRVGGKSNASFKNRVIANKEDRKAWKINSVKPYWFTLYLKPLRKLKQFFQTA